MNDLNNYAKVSIDILDENNNTIDKMEEPADITSWLMSSESPKELILFPSAENQIVKYLQNKNIVFNSVKYIPFNEKTGNKLEEDAFSGVWFENQSMEKAKQMAKELGIDYFFYSKWDAERIFILQNVNGEEQMVWGQNRK